MREEIEIDVKLAEKLAYYAMYGFIEMDPVTGERPLNIEGWTFLSKEEEGQKYGYLMEAVFHRDGDPEDEAWSTTFDVQSENEVFISGDTLTFYPRKKVVKVIEVVTWE